MKKMISIVLIMVTAVSFCLATGSSQSKMDAGLRLGIMNTFGGINARYTLAENTKIEALISTPAFKGTILTGMYQIHNQIADIQDLSWYFGGGIHMGYWKNALARWNGNILVNRDFSLGLDAIAGIQYDMQSLIDFPLIISLDYKPAFDIISYWSTNWADVALSIRYAF